MFLRIFCFFQKNSRPKQKSQKKVDPLCGIIFTEPSGAAFSALFCFRQDVQVEPTPGKCDQPLRGVGGSKVPCIGSVHYTLPR